MNFILRNMFRGVSKRLMCCLIRGSARSLLISVKTLISIYGLLNDGRSQRPRGLRHELSSPAQTLGSLVRIPLQAHVVTFYGRD
jgi:hypothetical protein